MSRRADAARRVLGWLTRAGLLALWALVGWGTLLVLVTAGAAVTKGPGLALGRLLPGPASGPWDWLNAGAAALAVAAWVVLAGLVTLARWTPGQKADDAPSSRPASPAPPAP